jgi:hypothetical protein
MVWISTHNIVLTLAEFAIVIVHHMDIDVAVVRMITATNSRLWSDSFCHNIETEYTVLDISGTCDICGGMVCFIRSVETTHRDLSQVLSLGAFQA